MKRALVIFVACACSSAQHPTANAGAASRTAKAGEPVTFDGSASTGTITSYAWDFGDSATADGVSVMHTYATDGDYTARLTVHGPGGADTTTVLVSVGAACAATAKIVRVTDNPMPGQTVLLGSSGSTGCMGAMLTTYEWDFGDGATASGDSSKATVGHTWAAAGTYMVKLHVVDVDGHEGRATYALDVGIVSSGKPQVVCQAMASGETGKAIALTASGSDPNNMALTYAWTFSDGATATGSNVSHAFSPAGMYTASVVATAADNRMSDPCTVHVTVNDPINYTGNWLISPSGSNFSGNCPFTVDFPTASLALFQSANPDGGADVLTVTPNGGTYPSGHPLSGVESTPGTFVVSAQTGTENPGGACNLALNTKHTIHFTFGSATAVTGSWTKQYDGCVDSSCLQCNCTAGGPIPGAFSGFPQ